jgi:hypothetical protein
MGRHVRQGTYKIKLFDILGQCGIENSDQINKYFFTNGLAYIWRAKQKQ